MPIEDAARQELKEAFLKHLPRRVKYLEDGWTRLCKLAWSSHDFDSYLKRVRELAGSSGRFGQIGVNQCSIQLERFLNTLDEARSQPSDFQYQAGMNLVAQLREEANQIEAVDQTLPNRSEKRRLFYLRPADSPHPGLMSELETVGFNVLTFMNADDMEGEVQKRLPDGIIVDGDMLPQMYSITPFLKSTQDRQHAKVPVVCIAGDRSLELRLMAIRTNVAAYYVAPVDSRTLAQELWELTNREQMQHRVLVIEDDISQAQFASAILQKAGMKTLSITQPLQVLDALGRFKPDLILMDLYMPDANGNELTTVIREHPDFVVTPIVFLSGEKNREKQLDALSYGADDFLSKPVSPTQLISTVSNRIKRSQVLQKRTSLSTSRDPVSGLYNPGYFFEQLDDLMSGDQADLLHGGILHIHIDRLEKIRQAEGEEVASRLLAELGTLITQQIEVQDVACRLNDNSLGVIASRPDDDNILQLAEKLRSKVEQYQFAHSTTGTTPTLSIGIGLFTNQRDEASTLLLEAARACKDAQQLGGNQSCVYSPVVLSSSLAAGGQMAALIIESLTHGDIRTFFQPLIESPDREITHFEIVLNLMTPEVSKVSAQDIREVARQAEKLSLLDRCLLEQSLNIMEQQRTSGEPVTLFVELSFESMKQPKQIVWLRDQLRSRQMVGTGLVAGFNTQELGASPTEAKATVNALRQMGIEISLTGFSASKNAFQVLHYLKADHIRLAAETLNVESGSARKLAALIKKLRARIVLPYLETGTLPPHWIAEADLVPSMPG